MACTQHSWLRRCVCCAALVLGHATAQAACLAGEYTDSIDGVDVAYRIPPAFNGTLIVYAEGYADSSSDGYYEQTPYFLGDATLAQALLDAGYLLAAADYSRPDPNVCEVDGDYCQGRWAVPLGVTTSAAVPARIEATQPDCVIERRLIAGADMGGLVALQLAESPMHSTAFDGALAMCTPGMGLSRWADGLIDYSIFREASRISGIGATPFNLGAQAANDVPWPFDWVADFASAKLQNEVQTSSHFPRLEFERLLARLSNPGNAYYLLPGLGIYTRTQLATELVADLQDQVGAPFGPLETLTGEAPAYSLDAADFAYLWSLLPPADPLEDPPIPEPVDQLVAALDAANDLPAQLSASPSAREALHALGEVTGDLRIPALMLHGKVDAATPDWSLTHYREAVSASMRSARFHGVFANTVATHCRYTPAQVLTALASLDAWAASGVAPTAADFPLPDFDAGYVPSEDPSPRVNVWLRDVSVTPGAGVQRIQATVVRSDNRSPLTLAYAISGGHTSMGQLIFPAGGDQRVTLVVDVADDLDQAVALELVQMSGPANVITPSSVLLPAPVDIFADGFDG
jgi:hypothetical protein